MKNAMVSKSLISGLFFTVFLIGCSLNDTGVTTYEISNSKNIHNQILFTESKAFNWDNKRVEVSFEDDFNTFLPIDTTMKKGTKLGYSLSENNLKQGLTIKLKVIDFKRHTQKTNEIMIESFDLSEGKNQFTLGHKENTPYIIY